MSFGFSKLGELGEMSFEIMKLGELGESELGDLSQVKRALEVR